MSIVIDVIIVAIVAICAIVSAKKGFVRSLLELVGYILALIIALNLGGWIATFIYDNVISRDAVEALTSLYNSGMNNISEALPAPFATFANLAGVDFTSFSAESGEEAALMIVEAIRPVAEGIIKCIAVLIIAIILIFVFKLLARLINSLFSGLVFGSVNAGLGAVIGGAKGIIFAVLASVLISFIVTASGGSAFGITVDTLDKTVVCKFILETISVVF